MIIAVHGAEAEFCKSALRERSHMNFSDRLQVVYCDTAYLDVARLRFLDSLVHDLLRHKHCASLLAEMPLLCRLIAYAERFSGSAKVMKAKPKTKPGRATRMAVTAIKAKL